MTQEEDDYAADDAGLDHVTDQLASLTIKKSHHHKHHTKSASTSSSIQRRRVQAETPKLTNLDQLTLHSASSQLVGTPYATDSKRFEYPFPDDESYSASSSNHATPAYLTPPLSLGSTYPLISAPSQLTLPCLIQPGDSSSSSSTTSSTSSFLPVVHPKLKPPANPPIPPSLVKKRPKWSLSIMGRRRSSYESPGGGFYDEEGAMDLMHSFLRGDLGDAVVVPHSQRDELSRSEH